ncbi:uncharacterized protein LOC110597297 isoform X1 [Ictidomys tridecemlineatus]
MAWRVRSAGRGREHLGCPSGADTAWAPPWQSRRRASWRSAELRLMMRPCPLVGLRGWLREWPGARDLAPSLWAGPARCCHLLPRSSAAPPGGPAPRGAWRPRRAAPPRLTTSPLQLVHQKKGMDSKPRAGIVTRSTLMMSHQMTMGKI